MDALLRALTELEKLKTVERGLNVGSRKESSAEHSWSCMLIADILIDYVDDPLDRAKVLELLLYHDLVEVYAGDAKFNNPEEMRLKHQKEQTSMEKINAILPNAQRYQTLMLEYENRASREAEFAKAVDCIDACIRNINDDKKNKDDGFDEALIRSKYTPHVSKFDVTLKLFEELMGILKEQDKV